MPRLNLLFVCSRNQWRSPTAETLYRDDRRFSVRARGLSDRSPRPLREADVTWADLIFVMESKHRTRLLSRFRAAVGDTPLHVLEIPDDYRYMDPELMEMIVDRVESCLRTTP